MSVSPSLKSSSNFDSNEDLLNLITSSWDKNRKSTLQNSKWTRDYLSRLTSLSLNELIKEPTELRAEQEKTKQDAQMLAYKDYPVFIHAQECRLELDETLQGLDGHLNTFVSAIPDLQDACKVFTQQAQAIVEDRTKITRVLEHQNVLVDLLEIPQLMDTCVWNGYYSEAMDLASHVRLLLVQYPLPVIESIQQQVQASCDSMLVQLVSHLRRPIKLAAAMSVIGHLRRMEAFQSETELRVVFLRSRHEFLEQRLERVRQKDRSEDIRKRSQGAFECLKRYIDVMREQMFEIAKQYMSVFPGQESMLLVSDYMIFLITQMRDMLKEELRFIKDTSSLASLLTQLQYCGVSLGRIGLDFRHLFVNSFEDAVLPLIQEWISEATADALKEITLATNNLSSPSSWMSVNVASSLHWQDNAQKRHVHQPPMLLVDYPILAVFTNNILSTFNALRLLPAVGLFKPIQDHLNECFLEIGNALKQYSDQAVLRIPEENVFLQSFCAAYVRWCVPFLQGCLRDGIYADFSDNAPQDNTNLENILSAYLPDVEVDKEEELESVPEQDDILEEDTETKTVDESHVDKKETLSELEDKAKDDTEESDVTSEEPKDESKGQLKDESIDNPKEDPKDETKEDSKDRTKEDSKDGTKEDSKDGTKEDSKDRTKEDSKDKQKEDPEDGLNEKSKDKPIPS